MTTFALSKPGHHHLDRFFSGLGDLLGSDERRACFALYARGILGDGERKSVEPIAARAAGGDPVLCQRYHDRLGYFLREADWSDEAVRRSAVRDAIDTLTTYEPIEAWVIDDTGFLKSGTHSPGVQRQYTGSAGKITNCQIAVSVTLATRTAHLPIDMDLYLPASWMDDSKRRAKARIPIDIVFRTKPQIALDLMARAIANDIPKGVVVADAAFGVDAAFRGGVSALGLLYAMDTRANTKVHLVHGNGTYEAHPQTVKELARALPQGAYANVLWRQGSRGRMQSRFARVRVRIAHPDVDEPVEQILLIEWPKREVDPTHFTLSTLSEETSTAELVRRTKQRWRTERTYEDLKGELGLDHFEGRTYPGWHHHVTVVLVCYAFLQTALRRSFPPSAECTRAARPVDCAA